ncbi:hypothetical protein SLEP1_g53065 [Rubroshorea leprosula]|uniref:Uncharacterized protein n=1 Tax=Rubroshorea leprosula TaxID=152421 RepID=A0AAV5M9D2_9ROSI|nr:hypothetical protein SLEP1_g53065 [Rubroshorea leprosula]
MPEGDLVDTPKGSLKDETIDGGDDNPFHETRTTSQALRGGLEEQLIRALDLNSGGIKIEVIDFHGKMYAEDYLDWEVSLENYFQLKHMAENRKVIFVKHKLNGAALQWGKRDEKQHSGRGKPNISNWKHMKAKIWKQFLPASYATEL